ncbi:MBL fold metallo-hydrolase [Rasiella sp. SM2506]|uniref:MBL fold metallo-hydrolase n=1 Tax=Rasiella sp. SM2506 TaxID=3423914 RepID=UPI003D7A87C8
MTKAIILSLFILFTGFIVTAQNKDEIDEKNQSSLKKDQVDKNDDNYKYKPSSIDVTENIFMLKGMGGNIAVQNGIDGALMIDTQFENASEFIQTIIQRKTEKQVEFIVNTHLHGDHVGGNKNFSRKGATVIAHKNVRDNITNNLNKNSREDILKSLTAEIEEAEKKGNVDGKVKEMKKNIEKRVEQIAEDTQADIDYEALPAISFENDLLFHYNDEDIQLIHLPNAHTNSDIIVNFRKSNVLHTGDAFVNGMYPYLDTKNGGSYNGYIEGLKKIERLCNKDTKIIPGHGELASFTDVKEMATMLELYYSRIKTAFLQNKTEDQVAAMRDFTKFYDNKAYGEGFITTEKFLRTLYGEVEKNEGVYKRRNEAKQKKYEESQKENKN